jgi:hypothetical protein
MKPILLLDESLLVEIFFEADDCGYEDNPAPKRKRFSSTTKTTFT